MIPEYVNGAYDLESWFEALTKRLESYMKLYNEHTFPFKARMFGFPSINIANKEECLNRIKELAELCGRTIILSTEKVKSQTGDVEVVTSIRLKEAINNGGK